MNSSPAPLKPVDVVHLASMRAKDVVGVMSTPEVALDNVREELQKQQRCLVHDLLRTYEDSVSPESIVWVNTYVKLDFIKQEIPEVFKGIIPHPRELYIYKHTAINKHEQSLIDRLEDEIEDGLRDTDKNLGLTGLLHGEWKPYIQKQPRSIVKLCLDGESPPALCLIGQVDNDFKSAFQKILFEGDEGGRTLKWYQQILFKDSWQTGQYVHFPYPDSGKDLPIDEAGTYIMTRSKNSLSLDQLELFELAFRTFLLEITTARLWGITKSLFSQIQRQQRIFEIIRPSASRVAEDIQQLEKHARRIRDALLPPQSGMIDKFQSASKYFADPPDSPNIIGFITVKSAHNFTSLSSKNNILDDNSYPLFISAVILEILGIRDEKQLPRKEALPRVAQFTLSTPDAVTDDMRPTIEALLCALWVEEGMIWDPSQDEFKEARFQILKGMCHSPYKQGDIAQFDAGLLRAWLFIRPERGTPRAHNIQFRGDIRQLLFGVLWFLDPKEELSSRQVNNESANISYKETSNIWAIVLTRTVSDQTFGTIENPRAIVDHVLAAARGKQIEDEESNTYLYEWITGKVSNSRFRVHGDWTKGLLFLFGDLARNIDEPRTGAGSVSIKAQYGDFSIIISQKKFPGNTTKRTIEIRYPKPH